MSNLPINTNAMEMFIGSNELFSIDWRNRLGADTLSASSWTVPTGITQSGGTFSASVSSVHLTSTTPGVYRCVCTVSTAGGNVLVEEISLTVKAT